LSWFSDVNTLILKLMSIKMCSSALLLSLQLCKVQKLERHDSRHQQTTAFDTVIQQPKLLPASAPRNLIWLVRFMHVVVA
jgi:hypothetical protein